VSLGGAAALFAAVFWALLVVFLIVTLRPLGPLLRSTATLVDELGQRLRSLVDESTGTASAAKGDLDKLGGVLDDVRTVSSGLARVTSLIEPLVSWPLEKLLAVTRAISAPFRLFRRSR
jgi:uncharacterized protein YoxC